MCQYVFGIIAFYCVWSTIPKCKNTDKTDDFDNIKQDWIIKIQRFWMYPFTIMFTMLGLQIFVSSCVMCYLYIIIIHGYWDQQMQSCFKDDRIQFAGIYAPAVAFLIAIYSCLSK